jgi:membrane fusion protein (multidrug efflux system)
MTSWWVLVGCGHGLGEIQVNSDEAGGPLDVETVEARAVPFPQIVELTGTVVADRQTLLAADTAGVVVETLFERGDRVTRGQVLAIVDPGTMGLSARAGAAQADAQRAQLDAAERECTRAEQLLADQVISRSQYERTMAQCEAQRRGVDAASASAAAASALVGQTRIRAPYDAIVGDRLVEVGAFVQQPSPVASLYADTGMRVKIAVPETQLPRVALGSGVEILPTSLPDRSYHGEIKTMSGALRDQTRDVLVEAAIADADAALRPGMFARVRIESPPVDTIVVPDAAILADGAVKRLFVVREGRAFELVVRTGLTRDGQTAVLTDLAAGDLVVSPVPDGLRDGRRVE